MTKLKLLTIITESALEHDLIKDVELYGAHGYTITEARGKGNQGLRDGSWENNTNIRVEVLCDSEVCRKISQHILEKYYNNFAMISYSHEIDVLRENKF